MNQTTNPRTRRLAYPDFEKSGNSVIVQQGQKAFANNLVTYKNEVGPGAFECRVRNSAGQLEHTVKITIGGDWVETKECTCENKSNTTCWHIFAALYDIRVRNKPVVIYGSGSRPSSREGASRNASQDSRQGSREGSDTKNQDIGEERVQVAQVEEEKKMEAVSEEDLVEQELTCPVCYDLLKDPVEMPCQSHYLCYDCSVSLCGPSLEQSKACKIQCPLCGKNAGVRVINDVQDLKPNRAIVRIQRAYSTQKTEWLSKNSSASLKQEPEQSSSYDSSTLREGLEYVAFKMDQKKMDFDHEALKVMQKKEENPEVEEIDNPFKRKAKSVKKENKKKVILNKANQEKRDFGDSL